MDYTQIDIYLANHLDNSIQELRDFCKIPTISAQKLNLQEGAQAVGKMLEKRGFEIEIHQTAGAPIVFAHRKGKSDKTLLFYNHYDVQPPEPLELWESPAFEPEIRGGKLYARGVSDDKGHITSRLFAIDAILDADGDLPCNVKFIIEGEEETSSANIPPFVKANLEKLAADACIWEFGSINHQGTPLQILGLRGICYVELSVETASIDTHSGTGGTIFPNAAWRLVWALNSLKGVDENVLIPGFYDNCIPPTQRDWDLFALNPDPAEDYKQRFGVKHFLKGTRGGTELIIQEVFEPSCTICGLDSGYQGPGSKTVLPARASAKVDFRLIPNQTPEEIQEKLRSHLNNQGFEDVNIDYLGGEAPGRTDPDDPFVQIVVKAAEDAYGEPMLIVPMIGGSGPNHVFLEELNLPIATAGIGYPGTKAHAPNENVVIDHYLKGAKHITRILKEFAES
ncbi:MAG: M20/M25/M40 family metallo-hydrolase [Anaerolineales bacterium]|nr:M20/M25/M40 family metallo-hydrolase [Anaerolineales bacterium]